MDLYAFLIILILAAAVFGILSLVFKDKKRRFLKSGLLAVVLSPAAYFLIVTILILGMDRENSRDFDADAWRFDAQKEGGTDNYEMIDDLIDRKLLINKDSSEVKEIFGTPEYRNKDRNFWQYYAGTGGGLRFTEHLLIIKFANNKVAVLGHMRRQD